MVHFQGRNADTHRSTIRRVSPRRFWMSLPIFLIMDNLLVRYLFLLPGCVSRVPLMRPFSSGKPGRPAYLNISKDYHMCNDSPDPMTRRLTSHISSHHGSQISVLPCLQTVCGLQDSKPVLLQREHLVNYDSSMLMRSKYPQCLWMKLSRWMSVVRNHGKFKFPLEGHWKSSLRCWPCLPSLITEKT